MKVRQVRLRSPDGDRFAERTCLLDDPRLKIGSRVTLKNSEEPERFWEVVWIAKEWQEFGEINRNWKVGGL